MVLLRALTGPSRRESQTKFRMRENFHSVDRPSRGLQTEIIICYKTNVSLVLYFYVIVHVLSDVERAALLNKDCFETYAFMKCALTYFLESFGKHYFFNSTEAETSFANALNPVRNFNTFKILTLKERIFFESL